MIWKWRETHNEGKSVVIERFIRTLKLKFIIKIEVYKYMTSKPKNVYIDKLEDTVNKYNNTYHSTIETKQFCKSLCLENLCTYVHMLLVTVMEKKS